MKDINVFVSNTSRDSWFRDRPDIVFNKTAVIHNPLILNNDDCDEEILKENSLETEDFSSIFENLEAIKGDYSTIINVYHEYTGG